ncbi:MarR family winged helix-turn-helix transcriptional regulator [Mycobacterium sp. DL592]|uniref:MarR family winged helix-turn-helix transcriptional regulator n=1 Tax=Mycobacterium sp. DL592 TaxID=2675524 RepID=UPI001421150C|nr:MarR family winged helix-turn-helix transcriptional regulator [Mycobacterium sp. DL592]
MPRGDADGGSSAQTAEDRPSQRGRRLRCRRLGFDEVETDAWLLFESVATVLHDIVNRGLVQTHRLTLVDVQMLAYLKSHGPSPMGAIAETLMVTPGALTQQTQRLERRRLVYRRASSDDGRRVIARITPEGARTLMAALETYSRLVRANFLDTLSRRQVIALGDGCRRINVRLKELDPSPGVPRS